jgi:ribonuclease R
MAKAAYTTENIGHFGLGFSHYAHFTSPIRRYADVLVHRTVFAFLNNESTPYDKAKLEAICTHISRHERMAMSAERESIKLKQAEYMLQFEGQEFDGKISGMIERGIFVNLNNGIGEGMVPFSLFDEPFELHRSGFSAKGLATGAIFAMGDRVRVRIEDVNVEDRRIEMVMVG